MKIEIGETRPANFEAEWEGKYEVFSHFEFAAGIPQAMFAVTSIKANGKPNIAFHAWSCFQGGKEGFFAILSGIADCSHTYENIMREREFCVCFLSPKYYDSMLKTIAGNDADADEFAVGGFTREEASVIRTPRIAESFLSLECRLERTVRIYEGDRTAIVIGRVVNLAAEEEYSHGLDKKYTRDGFMLNIHTPHDLSSGKADSACVATLEIERRL